jgi:DDE superfamily endonuclease
MTLLSAFLAITAQWDSVFPQQRTFQRAVRQALGSLVCLGRRCLTRIIWTNGGQHSSWSADYFLHSRCQWEPQQLFRPILKQALAYCPGRLVGVALDDTKLRKTGRCIPQAFYQRDPMSPPFHVNLVLGLRFLQASLLVPLHRNAPVGARALPIRFQEVSRVKRPGKKASAEMLQDYKEAAKQKNLSRSFVEMGHQLRQELDLADGYKKILVLTGDGSFCNRTCFEQIPERSVLLVRARKDAKLCFRAVASQDGPRRFYGLDKFTPESVRQDESHGWKTTKIFYGGKRRKIRYKEVTEVYWQRGAKQRPLRLIVIAPTPYRKSKSKRLYYREPAYLLTTDLTASTKQLLQIYFDRWQIEVNHREEKDTLGVGQAQLWNPTSVPKQPVLSVAAYSALSLASLQTFGAARGDAYAELPKWRRNARRPSCLDLVTLLRKEMSEQPALLAPLGLEITDSQMVRAGAA